MCTSDDVIFESKGAIITLFNIEDSEWHSAKVEDVLCCFSEQSFSFDRRLTMLWQSVIRQWYLFCLFYFYNGDITRLLTNPFCAKNIDEQQKVLFVLGMFSLFHQSVIVCLC